MAILKTSCILSTCHNRIPLKRQRRNAITCSDRHQKLLTKLRKQERDLRLCHHCGRKLGKREIEFLRLKAATRTGVRNHAPKNRNSGKGIPTPLQGILEIADVCPERSKKPKTKTAA